MGSSKAGTTCRWMPGNSSGRHVVMTITMTTFDVLMIHLSQV